MNLFQDKTNRLSAAVTFEGRRGAVRDGDRVWTSLRGTSVSYVFEHNNMLYLEDYTPVNVARLYGKCPHDPTYGFQPKEGAYSDLESALARFVAAVDKRRAELKALGVDMDEEVRA
jgi:hypothetical protein